MSILTVQLYALNFNMNALNLIFNFQIWKKIKINFTCYLCKEHLQSSKQKIVRFSNDFTIHKNS